MRDGPRRFTQDFSCPALLRCRLAVWLAFRIRGCHPLRPGFPAGSAMPPRPRWRRSYNPACRIATAAVWANARSLAATCAIILIFFSSGYLDVSVPQVRPRTPVRVTGSRPPGFPIRTSAGHRAFAPRRGFSQLVTSFFASGSQRHPPCALGSLSCPRTARGTACSPWTLLCTCFRPVCHDGTRVDQSVCYFLRSIALKLLQSSFRVPSMSMTVSRVSFS